MLEIKII